MATSTRKRALQVWKTHGENKPRDPGAVVIHGPGPGGAGRPLVGLPPDEETAVLAVDVHGQSCLQTAERLHVSVDTVKRLRRSAYRKLQDEIYTTR